ncbi:MAG: hypothetical protein FJ288_01695 [Planctomycetes bacterium]|nr:hypothetical protein [Planctomycetota bacterium]
MFLRRCERRKGRKRHTYWALVESVRTASAARPPSPTSAAWVHAYAYDGAGRLAGRRRRPVRAGRRRHAPGRVSIRRPRPPHPEDRRGRARRNL